jgi:hypothetical protein
MQTETKPPPANKIIKTKSNPKIKQIHRVQTQIISLNAKEVQIVRVILTRSGMLKKTNEMSWKILRKQPMIIIRQ